MKIRLILEPKNVRLVNSQHSVLGVTSTADHDASTSTPVDMGEKFAWIDFEHELMFHVTICVSSTGNENHCIRGVSCIHASELNIHSPINEYASPVLSISDPIQYLGRIQCRFVHLPTFHTRINLSANKLFDRPTPIFIGHRGSGANSYGARLRENTVSSFNATVRYPALDGVELDVSLTKDNKLVVYHDIEYPVEIFPEGGQRQSTRIPICLLDYQSMRKSRSVTEQSESLFVSEDPPLLGTVLQSLDPRVRGVVIELKYASNSYAKKHPSYMGSSRAQLVEKVMECLDTNWGANLERRWIVLSSFDPDICLMLSEAVKCSTSIAVVHNTWFGHETEEEDNTVDFSDVRNSDPGTAVEQALQIHSGIALEAGWVVGSTFPDIKHVFNGTKLSTYGKANLRKDAISEQMKRGVEVFFIDDLDLVNEFT
jgi:glycerophosphoryl diester phosphodiesterase